MNRALLLFFGSFLSLTSFADESAKMAVVDMHRAFNEYHKTVTAIEEMREASASKKAHIEVLSETLTDVTAKIEAADKRFKDNVLADDERKKALVEMQELFGERDAKFRELQELETEVNALINQRQKRIEEELLDEIRAEVSAMSDEQTIDLVLDRSFLPKSKKVIVHTSSRVVDLTDDLIKRLNAGAKDQPAATKPPLATPVAE